MSVEALLESEYAVLLAGLESPPRTSTPRSAATVTMCSRSASTLMRYLKIMAGAGAPGFKADGGRPGGVRRAVGQRTSDAC